MDKFSIVADNGYLLFHYDEVLGFPEQTSPFGGYDVWGQVEIKCDNYFVKGNLAFSTGEMFSFFTQLEKVEFLLKGFARFDSYEHQLSFLLKIDKLGHFFLNGEYAENLANETKLNFELKGDQSHFAKWINENRNVIEKYGDNTGVVKKAL